MNIAVSVRWRNYFEWNSYGNSFKQRPFSLQDTTFRLLKGNVLHCKRMPLAY